MDKRKLYRVNGYIYLFDPADPMLPANAEPVEKPKPKAKAAPKPKTKALKPENK